MSERTNLNISEKPTKYIVGSILLLVLSAIGVFVLNEWSKKEVKKDLVDNQIINEKVKVEEETNESTEIPEFSPGASESTTLVPSVNLVESFENSMGKFGVKYDGKRKVYEENEISGKRYVFFSPSGNITVHVGKTWSWINSGREFTDSLLIGGEKSYVYEITNQKIVDIEKDEDKYTIQCVHNALQEIKEECEKFLSDFYFM